MNLSFNWLHDYIDTDKIADVKKYCDRMTDTGSKVEGFEVLAEDISNVRIGKVVAMEHHPDSDHLWICQIEIGADAPIQIVTGAQNVKVGDMVPVAKHNSWLPGGVHITKGKLRGVKSNGMLCGLEELGLTVGDFPYAIEDGIFIIEEECSIGDDINKIIGNDDTIVDFEITNNRPDSTNFLQSSTM